ncbi:hypothetical protein A2881_03820 [Candidatus Peribacteria bacterium RIFCSPHIGHO2_01_FULL_55_13]|nr:MAG: hypothetical protein A2881_03820 [Candidatus Peribacteria bacterium RIFCSPHIGHO2_01_FULL_55_13]OGJ65866.1 MAG: hypothetical protein A3F36_04500 [Candidatus Peribacteria bacterium RIFCSPHIGHO2_12_FULL_55_11]
MRIREAVLAGALTLPGCSCSPPLNAPQVQDSATTPEAIKQLLATKQITIESTNIVTNVEGQKALCIRFNVRCEANASMVHMATKTDLPLGKGWYLSADIVGQNPPGMEFAEISFESDDTGYFEIFQAVPGTEYSVAMYVVPEGEQETASLAQLETGMQSITPPITFYVSQKERESTTDDVVKSRAQQ